MTTDTLLNKRGVRKRMQTDGRTAARIEDVFVTAEQLVEACESDEPLTEVDGIGPSTAEVISEWWDNAEEIERKIDKGEFVRTGAQTASIYNLGDWSDALGIDTEDEQ